MNFISSLITQWLMLFVVTSTSYAQSDSLFTSLREAKLEPNKVKVLCVWSRWSSDLDKLTDSLFIFPNLTELEIFGEGEVKKFPKSVLKLKQLKKIKLTNHHFESIPKEIAELDKLEELNLSSNEIQEFPLALLGLKQLKILKINYNEFSQIPKKISKLQELTHLELSECSLSDLPTSFSRLKKLKFLNLSENEFDTLPFCIGQLKSLKELNLKRSKIKVFPNGFGRLPQLSKLILTSNDFKDLPKSFSQLKQLEELLMDKCNLTQLPLPITKLSNLRKLDLSRNKFLELPIRMDKWKKLQYLDLSYCKMKKIPESIVNLTALEELNLSLNKIKALPDSISALQSIKRINLILNELESIPSSIGKLSNLEFIDCSFNYIREVPMSVANLTKLKLMDLKYNDLKRRPTFIKDFPDSIRINVLGNPFDLDREEKKGRILKTKNYFTDVRDGQVYPTIQINEDIWMCKNLCFITERLMIDSMVSPSYGRKYSSSELNQVCPEGWHNATVSEWKRLFAEVMGEFPIDPDEEVNKTMKRERKLKWISEEEPMIIFDIYRSNEYPVKWYISESHVNRKKKEEAFSNFYGLNMQLQPKGYAQFAAYKKNGKLALVFYNWYGEFVNERNLRIGNERYFSVRCVKD